MPGSKNVGVREVKTMKLATIRSILDTVDKIDGDNPVTNTAQDILKILDEIDEETLKKLKVGIKIAEICKKDKIISEALANAVSAGLNFIVDLKS